MHEPPFLSPHIPSELDLAATARSSVDGAGTGDAGSLTATARTWLRAEAVAAFVVGVALYGWLGAPWLALIPLLLVPDLSMIGYLGGPRSGALTYNLVHNWILAWGLLGAGLVAGSDPVAIAGAVLVAHVGMDRALGWGLKSRSSFRDTHLGRIGRDGGTGLS